MKLYLTKRESLTYFNYITNPINPFSIQPMGLVEVDLDEIMVDSYGAYVERYFYNECPICKQLIKQS